MFVIKIDWKRPFNSGVLVFKTFRTSPLGEIGKGGAQYPLSQMMSWRIFHGFEFINITGLVHTSRKNRG